MKSRPDMTRAPSLRGLAPDRLLGVLDEAAPPEPPRIPGWRINGVAGEGGSGIVWRASRESDGVEAAIKIADPADPDTLERIEREAEWLGQLGHPHIVALIESGSIDEGPAAGGLYLAMEFIDGPPLQHHIPEQGLPPQRAVEWFRQLAGAVAHAHDRGILHRDLKPGNVLVAPDLSLKVADFGLARPVHRRVHQLSLTRAGLVAGTAEYLPPEAYRRDHQPTQAGDIFALGVMLHEMLTGTPPRGAWKPASSRTGVDLRIDDIIARAMDVDPGRRWPDVRSMLAELDRVLASPPRFAGAPLVTFPVRVGDFLWTVLGLAILLAGSGSIMKLRKSRIDPPIELIGDHSALVGGFQALNLLLLAALPLGLWQLARLRRFRSVPMREALPSPFGLRLGHSRTAAWLVAACQGCCLGLPFLLMALLFLDSGFRWLGPDDPPWVHGLAVTSMESMDIISPWQPVFGGGFWLRESMGPPAHGLAQPIDRVAFSPFVTPLVMTLTGGLLALALTATVASAARQWWRRGRRWQPGLVASGFLALAFLMSAAGRQVGAAAALSRDPGNDPWVTQARMTSHVRDLAAFLLGRQADDTPPLPREKWLALYDETVDWRGRTGVSRREIPRLVENSRPRAAALEVVIHRFDQSWDPESGGFVVRVLAEESYDGLEPSGTCGAADVLLELTGTVGIDGRTAIRGERLLRMPMYEADARTPTDEEVLAWTRRLASALGASGDEAASALPDLFHRVPENPPAASSSGWIRMASGPLSALPPLVGGGPSPPGSWKPLIQGPLPGGRTRIRIPLLPAEGPRPPRALNADLIHTGGRWLCVRLAM